MYAGKTGGDYIKFTAESDREPLQFKLEKKIAVDEEKATLTPDEHNDDVLANEGQNQNCIIM